MAIDNELREYLPPDAIVLDNHAYDKSIIGVTHDDRVVYDFDKMVQELMNDEGWTEEDAIDWIEFNTLRALPYAGDKAPLIMYPNY